MMGRRAAAALAAMLMGALAAAVAGQVVEFTPAEPKWGDTVVVTYHTADDEALLLPTEYVRAVAYVYAREKARQQSFPVEREGDQLIARIPIEDGMCSLTVYFATPHRFDQGRAVTISIRGRDGNLAPGAHTLRMFEVGEDGWRDEFDRELELYPDSIYAYRQKWFIAGAIDRENQHSIIREDLAALETLPDKDEVEWLYVQVFGRMTLGDEAGGRTALLQLLEHHGDAYVTFLAHSDYQYQCFSQGIKGDGPEQVAEALHGAMTRRPSSRLARENAIRAARDGSLSPEAIEAIARAWQADEPDHPLPDFMLAQVYTGVDDERAIRHARRAIDGMLKGHLVFLMEVSGQVSKSYLRSAYAIWAESAINAERFGDAIAAAEAGVSLQSETDDRFYNLLGRAWAGLGEFDRAAVAYSRAFRAGDDSACDRVRELYVARHEHSGGFEAFFDDLTASQARAEGEVERPAAAAFDGTTLDGYEVSLGDLRGNVLVLNFWFIGCAPCRVEMPGLNELVTEYADRDDVKFIAFAMDAADDLREFLETTPFDYAVVPEAGWIAQAYEVQGFPTHVIVDREGRIASRLVGGSEDRHHDLRPLIERALEE